MTEPLSQLSQATMNEQAPASQSPKDYGDMSQNTHSSTGSDCDDPPSSPFVANVSDHSDRENLSPARLSRLTQKSPIEREAASPLKMLKSRTSPDANSPQKVPAPLQSPRKLSLPEKRFPVKPSSPLKSPVILEQTVTLEEALRDNQGLTKAIEILEDGDSDSHDDDGDTLCDMDGRSRHDDAQGMDDTMISTFSEFSAVPDMTMFAKIGHSPTKYATMGITPRRTVPGTPATVRRNTDERSPSPTPRGHRIGNSRDEGNTTNLILDFTEQISGFSGRHNASPAKLARQSPYKSSTMKDLSRFTPSTPSSNRMSNLLDFDIPPAPTPRSMPSITPRELETLKSSFLSEISSLKASLSGKEAEVQSLKTAVGDAEKRVGETMEQVREERSIREQLAAEKEEWEKRGHEMEAVLRNVKEEIVHGERERDELEGRLDETERRREAAETMAQAAESKMAAMRANKPVSPSEPGDVKTSTECICNGRVVEAAVEKVSRELHTLYKEKHETKVSALKKSYERRWEKRIRELEDKIDELAGDNEQLRLGRDTTMTKVEPKSSQEVAQDLEKQAARDAKTKELEAELEGLSQVVKSVKDDNAELRKLLDDERVEKGKLVQAVDEMIPLVAAFDDMLANQMNTSVPSTPAKRTPAPAEAVRGSSTRSGLRAPGSISGASTESRIGRGGFGAPSQLNRAGSVQGARPGSGLGYRSGIMTSIEKMGSYQGRANKGLDG